MNLKCGRFQANEYCLKYVKKFIIAFHHRLKIKNFFLIPVRMYTIEEKQKQTLQVLEYVEGILIHL